MNKTGKLLMLALNCLIVSPIVSVIISVGLVIPFVGIVLSIMAAIRIARFIEGNRKENFPDLNRFIFILCVYGPGLAASVILWVVGLILPDHTGYARLVCCCGFFGVCFSAYIDDNGLDNYPACAENQFPAACPISSRYPRSREIL